MVPRKQALFELGNIYATPGALAALEAANQEPGVYLLKHVTGDWSEMEEDDQRANQAAVVEGSRVFSAYTLPTGQRIWLITEWNRSATTVLLPEEY